MSRDAQDTVIIFQRAHLLCLLPRPRLAIGNIVISWWPGMMTGLESHHTSRWLHAHKAEIKTDSSDEREREGSH